MAEENIHASCVAIDGQGVLLLGNSGAGKSSIALQLIDGGAQLVSDDRCILFAEYGSLYTKAPASIAGLLEIRGVGIVNLPALARTRINLAVQLGVEDERLPPERHYRALNCAVPEIRLDASATSTPARIRLALTAHSQGLFRDSFNPK